MKRATTLLYGAVAALFTPCLANANPTWTYYDLGKGASVTGIRRVSMPATVTGYIVGELNGAWVYWTYGSGGPSAATTIPNLIGTNQDVYDVNSAGTIVGYAENTQGQPAPYGFAWTIGSPTASNLGLLIFPYSISNSGNIAGWNDHVNMGYYNGAAIPCPYGPTPGNFLGFTCVNDNGQATATVRWTGPGSPSYGGIYSSAGWYQIIPLQSNAPLVINDNQELLNQITNSYGNGQGTVGIYTDPQQYYVGVADAQHNTVVNWMNQSQDVTGNFNMVSPPTMPHAFWWSSATGQIDLNSTTYVPNLNLSTTTLVSGVRLSDHGTNNVGDIVGASLVWNSVTHAQESHAYLLVAN